MAALVDWRQKATLSRWIGGYRGLAMWMLAIAALGYVGCGTKPTTVNVKMGDTVPLGAVEHTVLGAEWRATLGEGASVRVPTRQFLVLRLAVTNKGADGQEVASLRLLAPDGTEFEELADGSSTPEWFGLVRRLNPGESRQGNVLFDAPKAVYQLKLTQHTMDGEEANVALVEIPIRTDETAIPTGSDPTDRATP
jgi:hypothetical protein